jgi:hypothetical protein
MECVKWTRNWLIPRGEDISTLCEQYLPSENTVTLDQVGPLPPARRRGGKRL